MKKGNKNVIIKSSKFVALNLEIKNVNIDTFNGFNFKGCQFFAFVTIF